MWQSVWQVQAKYLDKTADKRERISEILVGLSICNFRHLSRYIRDEIVCAEKKK